jgi:glycosyltransferase involved in cell wall biosynthesis
VTTTTIKHLLAISWEMPPLSGPRAVQVTRTLAALPEFGWHSRVVCFGPRSNRYHQDYRVSLEERSRGHATRTPVGSPEEWFLFRALWRVAPSIKHWPDEKRVWMPGALRAARSALAAQPANLIVSFAQPWTDHLVGLALARETGLPWVAHFSDPWVDSPYFRQTGMIRQRAVAWEREVIATATRVVFVNRHTRARVMAKYPDSWAQKADVVPQAWESTDLSRSNRGAIGGDSPMRMVYTGRFYDGIRTPVALLHAIDTVNREIPLAGRLVVEFVGADMAGYTTLAASLGLSAIVQFAGRLAPIEARARAAAANVLLVIDAPSPGGSLFLPSKLIDYLPLRHPILGITPTEGPSAELIRELGYPVVTPDDQVAIANAIRELLQQHAAGRLVPSLQHDTVTARFSIAKTTTTVARVLDQAVGR